MPANKMMPNATTAPTRTTCPASVKSGCISIASLTAQLCDRIKKKKAMTSEQIEAEKILVNWVVVGRGGRFLPVKIDICTSPTGLSCFVGPAVQNERCGSYNLLRAGSITIIQVRGVYFLHLSPLNNSRRSSSLLV